ncbi:hypothetical protein ACEV9T_22825 [Vibrio parahaemolyticus]
MNWNSWLEKWGMTSLKIKTPFLEMQWEPQDEDKAAAWELYIELLTRVTTQDILSHDGDEQAALNSIYSLFEITRNVIKNNGRNCVEFTKIAIVFMNQIIRPFTSKWHKVSVDKGFENESKCIEFRSELAVLQSELRVYTSMLAEMAGVEDLTSFEHS